ncbi:MAG: DUF1194 domain-containing protein [Paracoccaceae bacterium]|nr:DUF1194 domain-containing protein [Paracoccaceae bacterium]
MPAIFAGMMHLQRFILGAACGAALGAASPSAACDLALLLAVDVSGSVDKNEYRIQMEGLAEGLRDPVVSDALVRGQAALALVQWTGTSRQDLNIPWTTVTTPAELEALAERISEQPRIWIEYSTAIGEALTFAADVFDDAPACKRRVVDISGDGRSNEGVEPLEVHSYLRSLAITVNALVIRGDDDSLPTYFADNVILGGNAFVMTAENYDEYPDRMRRKLRRETERPISLLRSDRPVPAAYQD